MIFKGWDCHVKKCFITVNNVPLKNKNKAVHLSHSLSTYDDDSIVTLLLHNFGGLSNYFLLILNTVRPICDVIFLNTFI